MHIVIALIIFSLIIVIHELGHFLFAKKNGIHVLEFSVGMGPRILHFKKNDTIYSLKLLPFGGSCQMLGEDEALEEEGAFQTKSVWARISVVVAGPIFNFILAFVLALFIIQTMGYDPACITSVEDHTPAKAAGLQSGDQIMRINGQRIYVGREIQTYLQFEKIGKEPVTLLIRRAGERKKVVVYPKKVQWYRMGFTYEPSKGKVIVQEVTKKGPFAKAGLQPGDQLIQINRNKIQNGEQLHNYLQKNPLSNNPVAITFIRDGKTRTVAVLPELAQESYQMGFLYNLNRVHASPLQVIGYSAVEVRYWIITTIKSLAQMLTGKISMNDVAGPVGIVSIIGNAYEQSKPDGLLFVFVNLAQLSILLSANLGVMNLLPIPALDGGRLVFLLLEVLRGKPINREKEGMIHAIGLILLMIFMVWIVFHDVQRFF